jgi:hypothetical protein
MYTSIIYLWQRQSARRIINYARHVRNAQIRNQTTLIDFMGNVASEKHIKATVKNISVVVRSNETVEDILDIDALTFKECTDRIFSLPYFKNMQKDINKCCRDGQVESHIYNLTAKHGYRYWMYDFFSRVLIERHFERLNDIVRFHCKSVGRDLSMFTHPISCVEFSIIYNIVINALIEENKTERVRVVDPSATERKKIVKIGKELFDFSTSH